MYCCVLEQNQSQPTVFVRHQWHHAALPGALQQYTLEARKLEPPTTLAAASWGELPLVDSRHHHSDTRIHPSYHLPQRPATLPPPLVGVTHPTHSRHTPDTAETATHPSHIPQGCRHSCQGIQAPMVNVVLVNPPVNATRTAPPARTAAAAAGAASTVAAAAGRVVVLVVLV